MTMRIGDSFTREREDFLDDKYHQMRMIWDGAGLNQEEKLWIVWNFVYEATIGTFYDKKTKQVDTTLAHLELDKLVHEINEAIDDSNDGLLINKDKEK